MANSRAVNESGFQLVGEPAHLLLPRSPVVAFAELSQWLFSRPILAASLSIKQQFFARLALLRWSERVDWVRLYSLEALAAGLLCGALDGLRLYQGHPPDPFESPVEFQQLGQLLLQALEVADGEWRELHVDDLQLQAGYGKHLNRATEEENVEYLARPGSGDAEARRALGETFRTGYSLGLIDAAIVSLHGEPPDLLE